MLCEYIDEVEDNFFPDANFSVDIDKEELEDLITDDNEIIVKINYKCYCYDNEPRNTDYFYITSKGNGITIKDVILHLIDKKFTPNCSHIFLEGIYQTPYSSIQYECFFGS